MPDSPGPASQAKVTAGGEAHYAAACGACHGARGQGIQAMNAPRIAGLGDWYLATQLTNFKQRIRGAHPGDKYGGQMTLMSASLSDEKSRSELVAYINALK